MRVQKYILIRSSGLSIIVAILQMIGLSEKSPAQSLPFTQQFDTNTTKLGVYPLQNWGIFHKSDTINIQTSDGSTLRVFNIQGVTVYQGPTGSLPPLPVNHYFVECPGDRAEFCVLPDDYQGASFLGIDADSGTDSGYTQRINLIHPTWARALSHGQWHIAEPAPGVWDWELMDKMVAANPGRKIIAGAFIRPSWLIDNNQFLPQFLTYVTAMAQRYDGKIYGIQIWNEPWVETVTANGMAWGDIGNTVTGDMSVDGPVWEQTLATLIAASRTAIRSVSSSIKVFGPDWSSLDYANMTEEFIGRIGNQTLDAYTFHSSALYPSTDLIPGPDSTNTYDSLITPFIGNSSWMVTEYHPLGASAIGIPRDGADPGLPVSGISWQRGMDRLIQSVVMWRAAGAEAIMPHVMALGGSDTGGPNWEVYGWEWGRGPHPKTSAYLMTGYWLNNATFIDERTPGHQIFLYAWKRPDNSSLVFAWTAEGMTAPLQSTFTVTDIFGRTNQINALTENPALFSSTILSPSALMNSILSALTQNYSVPPVWKQPVDNQSIQAGQTLQFTVSAQDPNRAPITYSTSPLPAGASLDASTGVFTWTPTSGQIGSYDITITATDDQGKSTATSTTIDVVGDLLDGLVDYWRFDEGTGSTATDSVGQANGTLFDFAFNVNSGWTSGINGHALNFDGASSFVSLPSDKLNLTNNFTVTSWLYPRDAAGDGAFISVRYDYQHSGFRFFISQNNLMVQGETGTGGKTASFGSIQNTNWYHVAIVYDKSNIRAYINGAYQGSANWGGDLVMDVSASSRIGTQDGYFFNGLIDDVMIFDRTLSGQEVSELYQPPSTPPLIGPKLNPVGPKKVKAGQILAFQVSATNVEETAVSYSATPLPQGASFDTTNGVFLWSPRSDQVGLYNLMLAATDSQLSDSASLTITVTKSNNVPVLKSMKPKRARAGRRVRISLKGKDKDRDLLTYSFDSLPPGASFDPMRHRLEWIPTTAQVGQFSFNVSVTDGYSTIVQPMAIIVY